MAVTIVSGALLGIAQDAIGLRGFLEFFLGLVIAGIAVRMKFERKPAVRRFERRFIAIAADAENFVVVAFDHAQVLNFSVLVGTCLFRTWLDGDFDHG